MRALDVSRELWRHCGPLGELWEVLEELWEGLGEVLESFGGSGGALGELWEGLGELWDVSANSLEYLQNVRILKMCARG